MDYKPHTVTVLMRRNLHTEKIKPKNYLEIAGHLMQLRLYSWPSFACTVMQ